VTKTIKRVTGNKRQSKAILRSLEESMKALSRASHHLADGNAEPAALACTKAKACVDEAIVMVLQTTGSRERFAELIPEIRRIERAVWVMVREIAVLERLPNESLRFLLQSFIIEGGTNSMINEAGDVDVKARG